MPGLIWGPMPFHLLTEQVPGDRHGAKRPSAPGGKMTEGGGENTSENVAARQASAMKSLHAEVITETVASAVGALPHPPGLFSAHQLPGCFQSSSLHSIFVRN